MIEGDILNWVDLGETMQYLDVYAHRTQFDIYEEILDLENIIIDKNIKLNSIEKIEEESKEEILTQRKRTEINSSDYWKQKEIKKYEKLSFDEIKEKMDNKETSPELRKILFNILLKRIRRK